MNIYQTQAEAKVADIILESLLALGYELVRVKIFKGGATPTLQLMLGKADDSAINIKDCEVASRHVSVLLDVADPLQYQYNLEVSSPGIDRPLTRIKDFKKAIGQNIKLQTAISFAGRRNFIGAIAAANEEEINLRSHDGQGEYKIQYTAINEAKLLVEPPSAMKKAQKKIKSKKE